MKSYEDDVLRYLSPLAYLDDFDKNSKLEILDSYNKYLIDDDNYVYEIPNKGTCEIFSDEDYTIEYDLSQRRLVAEVGDLPYDEVYYVEPEEFFKNPDYYIKDFIEDLPPTEYGETAMQYIYESTKVAEHVRLKEDNDSLSVSLNNDDVLEQVNNDNEYMISISYSIDDSSDDELINKVINTLSDCHLSYYMYGEKITLDTNEEDNDNITLTIKYPLELSKNDLEEIFKTYKQFMDNLIQNDNVKITQNTL